MQEKLKIEMDLEEAKQLCLLLRKNEEQNTRFLHNLETSVSNYLFENMTIKDGSDFFYEN